MTVDNLFKHKKLHHVRSLNCILKVLHIFIQLDLTIYYDTEVGFTEDLLCMQFTDYCNYKIN